MKRVERDEVREERIIMEIIVDAYGPEEQSLGWYYHLEEQYDSLVRPGNGRALITARGGGGR